MNDDVFFVILMCKILMIFCALKYTLFRNTSYLFPSDVKGVVAHTVWQAEAM